MEAQENLDRSRSLMETLRWTTLALMTAVCALLATAPVGHAATGDDAATLAKKNATVAQTAMETYGTAHNGYRHATTKELRKIEPLLKDVRFKVHAKHDHYQIAVPTKRPTTVFRVIRNINGSIQRTCTPPGRNGCPEDGIWTLPPPQPPTAESIDAEAKAGVITAAEAMETCATDNNGVYSTTSCTTADLKAIEPTLNDLGARLTVTANTNGYWIDVYSNRDSMNVKFRLARAPNGTTTRTCTVNFVSRGGCPANGIW